MPSNNIDTKYTFYKRMYVLFSYLFWSGETRQQTTALQVWLNRSSMSLVSSSLITKISEGPSEKKWEKIMIWE